MFETNMINLIMLGIRRRLKKSITVKPDKRKLMASDYTNSNFLYLPGLLYTSKEKEYLLASY